MTTAFVLGNGVTRKGVNLEHLRTHGTIYGCNALYRDFTPDVLIATDRPISEQIQHSGYPLKNKFYTRKPLEGLGAHRVPEQYWGYSSGPLAAAISAADQNLNIYLLGFDMAGINDRFNNVYADSEFYKRSAANPTYTGNWERQLLKVMKDYPHTNFIRVHGAFTADVPEFNKHPRYARLNIAEFQSLFGV
jgi:hypothetical protein